MGYDFFFRGLFCFSLGSFQVENSVKGCKVESLERKSADFILGRVYHGNWNWHSELVLCG